MRSIVPRRAPTCAPLPASRLPVSNSHATAASAKRSAADPPVLPRDQLRRGVGPPQRTPQPYLRQRRHDAEAGHARPTVGDEYVAQVQRAVEHAARVRRVQSRGELVEQRQGRPNLCAGVAARRPIERFRSNVFLDEIRCASLDTHRHRHDDSRVKGPGHRETLEGLDEQARLLGCDIDAQLLDNEGAIAGRVVGVEYRPQNADPYLMQHTEGAERTKAAW